MKRMFFFCESKIPFSSKSVVDWLLQPSSLERLSFPLESIKKFGYQACKVIAVNEKEALIQDSFTLLVPFYISKKWLEKKINHFILCRDQIIQMDLKRVESSLPELPLRVLVTGSSGFIGKALCGFLKSIGIEIVSLTRQKNKKDSIYWNPEACKANLPDFEGFDGVIHLAGESLSKGFWTENKKKRILESRIKGTDFLVSILSQVKNPPKVFIGASAIGYYESSLSPVTEESSPGHGFLSKVCLAWETASKPLEDKGIRTVHARLGLVLDPNGGILKSLLPLFRFGLGARLGSGKQIMSWISLEDVIGAFYHILRSKDARGPINIVSPFPVSQEVFAKTLAQVLSKPCFFSIPKSLFPGEKARELLFDSKEVIPMKLEISRFTFLLPKLEQALEYCIRQMD